MHQLQVNRSAIRSVEIAEAPEVALAPGQARLKIERLALTANTVTYAASGDAIGYWKFFPLDRDGWGLVPAWGYAEVTESESALSVGARYYGFWPIATELVVTPDNVSETGFVDGTPHRRELPPVYNRYRTAPPEDVDDLRALLQPLLATSYFLDDFLSDSDFFGADQVIIGSASSKTGFGLARFLSERRPDGPKVVGLTGNGNVEFCETLGYYDQVVPYDRLSADLPKASSVYVDMAGNAQVRRSLRVHLADDLKHSCAVGISHWDRFDPAPDPDLPGAAPKFFFAPAWIEKRRNDWGPAELNARLDASWRSTAADSSAWMTVKPTNGLAGIPAIWTAIADGKASPKDGHIAVL